MEDWYTGEQFDPSVHDVELVNDQDDLNPGGEPIKVLRSGWWQRVRRTSKGWALVRADEAWVEAAGGDPVLVIDRWIYGDECNNVQYICLIPGIGLVLVHQDGLS
jgi:hypothetical protein